MSGDIIPEGVIGAPSPRVEGAAKVTGAARYGDDHAPPGAAYGHLRLSSIARGRIVSIDPAPALAMPGVLLVLTYENVGKAIGPGKWFLNNGYMQSAIAPLRDDHSRLVSRRARSVSCARSPRPSPPRPGIERRREHGGRGFGGRELQDPNRPPPVTRQCLCCREPFPSSGPGHRLCVTCRSRSSEVSPFAV